MSDAGIYVYGIVPAEHPCWVDGLTGVGGQGAAVRRLAASGTAAVVSAAPAQLRAKRRDLLVHQEVLTRVWRQGPVLPTRFGVVAPGEEGLRAELDRSAGRHTKALAEIAGCGEMHLQLTPDEDALVRQIAETDPVVHKLLAGANGRYLERLRLGEVVAAAVQTRIAQDRDRLARALAPLAVRTAGASFLVRLARVDEFADRAVALETPVIRLRITGPMPPYSLTD